MITIQLDTLIPLETPKGPAMAHFLINPGDEHHLQWVVFVDGTGECWTFSNPEIRLQSNATMRPVRRATLREIIQDKLRSSA